MSVHFTKPAFLQILQKNPSWRRFIPSDPTNPNSPPKPQIPPTKDQIKAALFFDEIPTSWEIDLEGGTNPWRTKDGRRIIFVEDIYDYVTQSLNLDVPQRQDFVKRIQSKYAGILESDIWWLHNGTGREILHDIVTEQQGFWESEEVKWLKGQFEEFLSDEKGKFTAMWHQCLHGKGNSNYEDAEILLRTTAESIIEHESGRSSLPMLIRDIGVEAEEVAKKRPYESPETFIEMLKLRPDLEVQVQNMGEEEEATEVIPVSQLLVRLKYGVDLQKGLWPNNLLSLSDHTSQTLPAFLENSTCCALLAEAEAAAGITGPKKLESGDEEKDIQSLDKTSCQHFKIFGQAGSVSSWHKDMPSPGTWITMAGPGLKLWPILNDLSPHELQEYATKSQSHNGLGSYKPLRPFPAVFLRDNDTWVMRPGLPNIHAVLTLKNSLMNGGMYWDDRKLMWILRDWRWTCKNYGVANEDPPEEVDAIVDYVEGVYRGDPGRFPDVGGREGLERVVYGILKYSRRCGCGGVVCERDCECVEYEVSCGERCDRVLRR